MIYHKVVNYRRNSGQLIADAVCLGVVSVFCVDRIVCRMSNLNIDPGTIAEKTVFYEQSKKDSNDQESIQSSTTPAPRYQMGK